MDRLLRQPTAENVPVGRIVFDAACLSQGLRAMQPLTLMTMGQDQEPAGPYLPSILY